MIPLCWLWNDMVRMKHIEISLSRHWVLEVILWLSPLLKAKRLTVLSLTVYLKMVFQNVIDESEPLVHVENEGLPVADNVNEDELALWYASASFISRYDQKESRTELFKMQ